MLNGMTVKNVKFKKQKMHPWRTQYRNFLWAVWQELPYTSSIKSAKDYETVEGKSYSDVVKFIAAKIHEFLFSSHDEFDQGNLKFHSYINIRGIHDVMHYIITINIIHSLWPLLL